MKGFGNYEQLGLPEWAMLALTVVTLTSVFLLFLACIIKVSYAIDNFWPVRWTMVTRPRKIHATNRLIDKGKDKCMKEKNGHNHRSNTALSELQSAVRTSTPLGRAATAAKAAKRRADVLQ